MNGKEYVQSFHYFDKRTNEEDLPVALPTNIQDKYEQIEIMFEEFFDDNSLSLAKVIFFIILYSKIQKKREIKED
jgi:hypothetical protein